VSALNGTVSAGTVYPANGDIVGVKINGVTQNAAIAGGPGGFSISYPTASIPSSASAYTITYTYAGNGTNLNAAANNTSTTLTVSKATPIVTTWPSATAIIYGQTLASSTLSGGVASVAGSFAFTTPSTAPVAGTASQAVKFTPTDAANYNNPASGFVSLTVSKATPIVTTWPSATAITYGQTLAASTLSGGAASVAGSFAFTTPTTAPAAGTAAQGVTFTPTDTANYNTAVGSASVTVNKAWQVAITVELEDFAGSAAKVTFAATSAASVKISEEDLTGGSPFSCTLTVPADTTHISAKGPLQLRRKLALIWDENGMATLSFTGDSKLLGGDLNNDNRVTMLDYAILRTNWGTTSAGADIDGGGVVGASDYDLLRSNWIQTGDPE